MLKPVQPFLRTIFTVIGILAATGTVAPSAVAGPDLATRTNDSGGVRVVVTPKSVGTGAVWEFDVTMSTHVEPLNADLVKTAALVDGDNRRYTPLAWEGDPPGGHHRKGVLRFPSPAQSGGTFKLQIGGVGGNSVRTFQWRLN